MFYVLCKYGDNDLRIVKQSAFGEAVRNITGGIVFLAAGNVVSGVRCK